jgi:pimeloyl-ACP methyl ester carboxylesterase
MGKGRVVIIHGVKFRKKDKDNLRRLATGFRAAGFCVTIPSYGYLHPVIAGLVVRIDRRIADTMAGFIRSDDILVGHSNGATITHMITEQVRVRGCVLINPALDSQLTPNADFVHVYHNRGDWLTRLSALIPHHPWGCMGAAGYTGASARVTNFDQNTTPGVPALDGHSAVFERGNIRPWSRFMADRCVEELEKLPATRWSNCHD